MDLGLETWLVTDAGDVRISPKFVEEAARLYPGESLRTATDWETGETREFMEPNWVPKAVRAYEAMYFIYGGEPDVLRESKDLWPDGAV